MSIVVSGRNNTLAMRKSQGMLETVTEGFILFYIKRLGGNQWIIITSLFGVLDAGQKTGFLIVVQPVTPCAVNAKPNSTYLHFFRIVL
jgi:hypothetical protein